MANKFAPRQFDPKRHQKQPSTLILEEIKAHNQTIAVAGAILVVMVGLFVSGTFDFQIAQVATR